jgi:hypothetical protein
MRLLGRKVFVCRSWKLSRKSCKCDFTLHNATLIMHLLLSSPLKPNYKPRYTGPPHVVDGSLTWKTQGRRELESPSNDALETSYVHLRTVLINAGHDAWHVLPRLVFRWPPLLPLKIHCNVHHLQYVPHDNRVPHNVMASSVRCNASWAAAHYKNSVTPPWRATATLHAYNAC